MPNRRNTPRCRPIVALFLVLMTGPILPPGAGAIRAADGDAPAAPDPAYWRLDEIRRQLADWQGQHPDLVQLNSIGTSVRGETIDAICLSDNVTQDEGEPGLIFHAAQHANECNGTTAIMHQIADLLDGYGRDPRVTARIDGLELWFIPVLNPDGHRVAFGAAAYNLDWRKNLRDNDKDGFEDFPHDGVDLNRNWDWNWQASRETDPVSNKYKGPRPFSEPESAALRDLILAQRPVMIIDYHSPVLIEFRNYIFFPWISLPDSTRSPDWDVARDIAQTWADATVAETGLTFSAAYAFDTLPKQQNWSYGRLGILSFLMEISEQCWWTGADVDSIGTRVARGSTVLLDRVLDGPGLRGDVTDAATGTPLVAEVRILEMHDDTVGPHLTEPARGRYFRLTEPGTWTLEVRCEGYVAQTRHVTVADDGWADVDIALTRTGEP